MYIPLYIIELYDSNPKALLVWFDSQRRFTIHNISCPGSYNVSSHNGKLQQILENFVTFLSPWKRLKENAYM